MSSTVANRLTLIAALAMILLGAVPADAAQRETEAKVVARLYKDYAWQAIATQPDLFGEGLAGASKAELERYFSAEMAQLLFADSACQARTGEICNLNFDVLFDSQDPRVVDLDVQRVATGSVLVQFKDPITDKKTVIEFKLAMQQGKWRIADIVYRGHPQQSLKTALSPHMGTH
ncbi:hypothetical protein GCM10027321_21220 [Massilia terrae]|uniref:DUF3828 domain-containing protein n=1 Tax=Massilia terrae TaxID=1811224 RepID=A0ABT2CYD3_9BURK|nr:DUF3828 domain-containing protein [Massilia terrae]MCS0658982.1 DUF3828 domain-containing protein [Massilia terrae]